MLTKRNIVTLILLSVFTCGIYSLYWMVVTTDELNQALPTEKSTSGGTSLILSIITCGIYGIYWQYCICRKMDELNGTTDWYVPFLFYILLSPIISNAVLQDRINKN